MRLNYKALSILLTLALLAAVFMPIGAQAAAHGAGTNIVGSDGTVFMITLDGQRRPYTSAGAFLSYGFNTWASVVPANSDDLALPLGSFIPPQNGKVFCSDRGGDKGTCYIIGTAGKIGIPSEAIFSGLGYSFSRALYGDVSFLAQTSVLQSSQTAHSSGTLVNNNGTVYLVGDGDMLAFPTASVFDSWGYDFLDVVMANDFDRALPLAGVAAVRQPGQLQPIAVVSISSLSPASGPAGTQVTITGKGFSSSDNTVQFSRNTISNLNSGDGNTLTFIVPSFWAYPCPPNAPLCPGPISPNLPGQYPVYVTNSNGTSNNLTFTVTDASTAPVTINSLSPSSGPVGTNVTISGTGFTPTGNTIQFDIYNFTNVAATNNGSSLAFIVPAVLYYNNCPPGSMCPNMARNTTPGNYNISVSNANGTSNTLTFMVTQ